MLRYLPKIPNNLLLENWSHFRFNPSTRLLQSKKWLHITTLRQQPFDRDKDMPTVYYYQNPLQYLRVKWKMFKLRKWDEDFTEKDFTRGSTQAVSAVTKYVSHKKYDDLEGLLTPTALSKLRRDILVLWNDDIVNHIGLKHSDIKLAVPTRVTLLNNTKRSEHTGKVTRTKVCDIDMWYMAMKWRDMEALLIIDLVARFHKDFNDLQNPDWTISFFELRKYHVRTLGRDS